MNGITFYPLGQHPTLIYACSRLAQHGFRIADTPDDTITHVLLPVPSFDSDGNIRGGGDLKQVLDSLPRDITIMGGNLNHPALAGYRTQDLLQDHRYLAENAAITADCALAIGRSNLTVVYSGCPVLILGWGRIGKCLARQLKALGAEVTVAVRKEVDLAMLQALGYGALEIGKLHYGLMRYRVIFNTVPYPVLSEEQVSHCRQDCVKIDLASKLGIAGDHVIWARGLPGKDAPESSGLLIAKTVIRLLQGKEFLT